MPEDNRAPIYSTLNIFIYFFPKVLIHIPFVKGKLTGVFYNVAMKKNSQHIRFCQFFLHYYRIPLFHLFFSYMYQIFLFFFVWYRYIVYDAHWCKKWDYQPIFFVEIYYYKFYFCDCGKRMENQYLSKINLWSIKNI